MQRALLLAAALALPALATAEMMQPGMYRSTTTSPGEKPETSEQCVTQKDIDEGLSALGAAGDKSCKVLELKRGASNVSYRTACSSNGMNMESRVNATFTRDSFDMTMAIKVADETSNIHVVGKRMGACKGK